MQPPIASDPARSGNPNGIRAGTIFANRHGEEHGTGRVVMEQCISHSRGAAASHCDAHEGTFLSYVVAASS